MRRETEHEDREKKNGRYINNYVNVVIQDSSERRREGGRGGPRRQNISLVPSDGAGSSGVCGWG